MTGVLLVLAIVAAACALNLLFARRVKGPVRGSHTTTARFLGGRSRWR